MGGFYPKCFLKKSATFSRHLGVFVCVFDWTFGHADTPSDLCQQ